MTVDAPEKTQTSQGGHFYFRESAHTHTCVTRGCHKKYRCTNNCDTSSLDDAPCPSCFETAMFA